MTHGKLLTPHEKGINEARINYTSQEASKFLCWLEKKRKKKLRKHIFFLFF